MRATGVFQILVVRCSQRNRIVSAKDNLSFFSTDFVHILSVRTRRNLLQHKLFAIARSYPFYQIVNGTDTGIFFLERRAQEEKADNQ